MHAENGARVIRSCGDETSPLTATSVEKHDVTTRLSALDDHLLAVTMAGHHDGTARFDGLRTGARVSNLPGSLCFLPRGRAVEVSLHGHVRYEELLIGRATMEAAAAELFAGDPAGIELAGFNSLLDPVIERHALRAAAHLQLHRGGITPVDDALALVLCAELVAGYSLARPAPHAGSTPRLVGLRLMAVLEQLERGRDEELRLEALARTAELPPLAFVRAFEVETGMTLDAFLAERRIDRLRVQLDGLAANEPLELHRLAAELGYSGPTALERACIRALGVTPAGYLASRRSR